MRERSQPISLASLQDVGAAGGREGVAAGVSCAEGGAQEVLQGPLGSASAPTPQPRGQFLPLLISAALLP